MYETIKETATVRELLQKYPDARRVFERFGVDYCCGGSHDLKTAAAEAKIPVETLLMALASELEAPLPGQEPERNWNTLTATELVEHVLDRHHAFMREQLPRIDGLLDKVLKVHVAHRQMLTAVQETFHALKDEIEEHLFKEENILFPLIVQWDAHSAGSGPMPVAHCGAVQNPIRQMEHEHDSAGAALARLRELTGSYSPPPDACPTFRTLYEGLQAIEPDLHQHIHLENNYLFPKAVELEAAARKA